MNDPSPTQGSPSDTAANPGLSAVEVLERRRQFGPNSVPEQRQSQLLRFLRKFASPVPILLEITAILELVLDHGGQALLVLALLVFNAIVSFLQESSADRALTELRSRLAVTARVRREGAWQTVSASDLVPDDLIYLRAGDIVPADGLLQQGLLDVDESALSGESAAKTIAAGKPLLSGSIVKRGEASAIVTATGARSASGHTAELVQSARTRSHLEETVLAVVKYLVFGDALLALAVVLHSFATHTPVASSLPFALMLLIASVPVALPATFSLAIAFGTHALTRRGILVTRLPAVQEFAAMNVLCADKTGTITENSLTVNALLPLPPFSASDVLRFAALASDEATQDPIDLAVLALARPREPAGPSRRTAFVPFDPATKRSEARFEEQGKPWSAFKGAPQVLAQLAGVPVPDETLHLLAGKGARIIAVAAGPVASPRLIGLIGLRDPPRADSRAVIVRLNQLGVRVLMVTGDDVTTASAVAREVGLGDRVAAHEAITSATPEELLSWDVFAGVYPEDKLKLVERLQSRGCVVGMTGDGVNDAPALKRAEAGVAVSNATDVAKAAASLVLTRPGLSAIADAVIVGREIYQRMLTYTTNKIVKTFHLSLLLSMGVMFLDAFVTTPRHLLLLLFLNDFVTMSLSSDRVQASARPDQWNLRSIALIGGALALCWTALSFTVWWAAESRFGLDLEQRQTIIFVLLVLTSQATIYLVRTLDFTWRTPPGKWLAVSTVGDLVAATLLATTGLLMKPVPVSALVALFAAVVAVMGCLDALKVWFLHRRARTARSSAEVAPHPPAPVMGHA